MINIKADERKGLENIFVRQIYYYKNIRSDKNGML